MKELLKKYCIKNIFFYVILYFIIFVVLKIILSVCNYTFLKWIDITSMIVIILGVILGTVQLIYVKAMQKSIKYIIGLSIILLFELLGSAIIVWGFFKFSPNEEILFKDGKKMIKESHYELLSNDIEYYDYINIFVRSKNIRIIEDYNDAVGAGFYKGTLYYDENGELIEEYNSEGKLIFKKEETEEISETEAEEDTKQTNDEEYVQPEILYEKQINENVSIRIEICDYSLGGCIYIAVMKSTDAGETWENQIEGEDDNKLFKLHKNVNIIFFNENLGFINYLGAPGTYAEDRALYVTTDGGKNIIKAKINLPDYIDENNFYIDGIPYVKRSLSPFTLYNSFSTYNILNNEIETLGVKAHVYNPTGNVYYEFISNDNGLTWNVE